MNGVDVLVLHYLNGKDENYELNQVFWKERYSANINRIVEKLIRLDYVTLDTDIEKSLSNLKVPDLKEILKENDLKLSGNKKDLINRIISEGNITAYQKYLKKVWVPTKKGKQLITDTGAVFYAHSKLNHYSNVIDVYKLVENNPNLSEKEILIKSVNDLIKFNGRTSSYDINITYPLWELSKVCRDYDDDYGQFNYLVKSCVSSFITDSNEEFFAYLLDNFDYFVSSHKIPEVVINDLKLSISSHEDRLSLLAPLINSYTYELNKIHFFDPYDIQEIILASLKKDDERFLDMYTNVFERAGGKTPKKTKPLKNVAIELHEKQSEENELLPINHLINKVTSIFRRFKN